MKYLFFDIDGTLLSHEEGISKTTIEALRKTKEKGNKIFICTGRSYAEIPQPMYQFGFDGVIAAAGGYVKVEDKIIFNKIMPEHLVDNLIYYMEKLDLPFVIEGTEKTYSHKDGIYRFATINEKLRLKMEETKYEYAAYHFAMPKMLTIEEYLENRTPISKAVVYAKTPEQLIEVQKYIDKDFDLINYGVNGEIIAKGYNKFTGIQEIIKYYNADIENTFAIGDSLNDYEMILNSKIGVAMGNATDDVKEIADFVTTDVDDNGIYNALEKFNLL